MWCECGHDKNEHVNPGEACRYATMKHSPCKCKRFATCTCETCVTNNALFPLMTGAANG